MTDVLDSLFAQLARLLVTRGVPFPDFAERMKAHYVQAATAMADGKITDSRLSVMTGLQRRDVVRLRTFSAKDPRPNHLSRLVALWQSEPGYHRNGAARELSKNGPAPSFEALARQVRRDVHPRTMLDELERAGTVAIDPKEQSVALVQMSYQPPSGSGDQLVYLTKNIGDHLAAAVDNVQGLDAPHFERSVHYSELTEDQINALKADYETAQMKLFRELSPKAAAMKRASRNPGAHRFRAGGYFYRTEEAGN